MHTHTNTHTHTHKPFPLFANFNIKLHTNHPYTPSFNNGITDKKKRLLFTVDDLKLQNFRCGILPQMKQGWFITCKAHGCSSTSISTLLGQGSTYYNLRFCSTESMDEYVKRRYELINSIASITSKTLTQMKQGQG